MATPHIESEKGDIAKVVLMPGDPLRAKYIADNFLTDVRVVNNVRNMTAYTGKYKGKEMTVFPHGMGIPSCGIYFYELYKFYDVEKIIRIGTCGSNNRDVKILDDLLANSAYTLSTFPKLFDGTEEHEFTSSMNINNKLIEAANENNIAMRCGRVLTSDVFDVYCEDHEKFLRNFPDYESFIGVEMESAGLFYLASKLNKEAACVLTVVDSHYDDRVVTSEDRQTSLNQMITVALEGALKL
jgi:purine-nucleoside phosphorylase